MGALNRKRSVGNPNRYMRAMRRAELLRARAVDPDDRDMQYALDWLERSGASK